MMENSQAWLGASSSAIANDSYQYQLQSMWQKCWNSQNLIHHLRFRERGPLKSWRPETMAEAIFSVLKEGLSLSQAARKFDIPYPTFVLYANRVHNMLGPSIDGGTDLRPKGRGRPQRILLGIWPDDHIKGVIKSVVFRDAKDLKEEPMHMYGRHSPFPFQDGPLGYSPNANGLGQVPGLPGSGVGGPVSGGGGSTGPESMSPDAVSAAISAVRQQMCNMVAAAQHHPDAANMLGGFNLPGHLSIHPHSGGAGSGIPIPKLGSPANLNSINNNGGASGIPVPRLGSPAHGLNLHGLSLSSSGASNNNNNNNNPPNAHHPHSSTSTTNSSISPGTSTHPTLSHSITNLSKTILNNNNNNSSSGLSITRISSPTVHDLRMPSPDNSPSGTPVSMVLEPAVNLALSGSSSSLDLHQKSSSCKDYSPQSRSNHDSARSPSRSSAMSFKDTTIKMEPMAECRGD